MNASSSCECSAAIGSNEAGRNAKLPCPILAPFYWREGGKR